jgi:hypothetical protein
MPRFYFDIREGPRFVPDAGGEDLKNLEAAKCYAARLAGEITSDLPLRPAGHVIIIEVCDEHKQRVLTMTVSLSIERPDDGSRPWTPWSA